MSSSSNTGLSQPPAQRLAAQTHVLGQRVVQRIVIAITSHEVNRLPLSVPTRQHIQAHVRRQFQRLFDVNTHQNAVTGQRNLFLHPAAFDPRLRLRHSHMRSKLTVHHQTGVCMSQSLLLSLKDLSATGQNLARRAEVQEVALPQHADGRWNGRYTARRSVRAVAWATASRWPAPAAT